jgi:hypothetical protein
MYAAESSITAQNCKSPLERLCGEIIPDKIMNIYARNG